MIDNPADPESEGKRVTGIPRHTWNIGLDTHYKWVRGRLTGHYFSKIYSDPENKDTEEGVYHTYEPALFVDAKVSVSPWKWMEISLSVDNLFDKEYYECYKTRVGPFLRNLRCDNNMRALYMNRIVFCLTWLILVVSAFWAQSRALGASNAHVDCMGREAEVSLPVKKVVALNSDVLEALRS
ncbi:MAG TPA: TonB-dependent receptor, partial [Desulfobacterales bacterium]|nr:TonB-dependent receptor [Desulfobacterales bacterium]